MSKLRAPQIDTGTNANQIVELDGSGNLPAAIGGTGVKWQGAWADGAYLTDDMVKDGDWTMVATVDTSDRAAPQTTGSSEHAIDPNQALITASNSSVVRMVHRFTMLKTGWIQQVQVRVPFWDLDSVSRITLYNVTTGDVSVINNPILHSDEWITLFVGNILYETGTVGEVWFEFYNSVDANAIDGGWVSDIGTGIPLSQEFTIDSVTLPTVIEISHTDLDSNTRTTELDGVTVGSTILISETGDISRNVEVEVTAVDTTSTTSTKYTVSLLNLGAKNIRDGNTCTIHIDVPITQPSKYSVITDYYLGSTNQPSWATIVSRLYFDNVQQADTDDAYGINILFQEASFSPDWDVVSVSDSSGGGSSNATSVEFSKYKTANQIVNNSTTLVDDTELQTNDLPVGLYEINIMLAIKGPTAADMDLGWTVTNELLFLGSWSYPSAAADPDSLSYTSVADDTDVATVKTDPTAISMINFKGTLNITTSPGSIVLRFAQSAQIVGDTQILGGSYMKITKLG